MRSIISVVKEALGFKPKEVNLNPAEQKIADSLDRLPRQCRRAIERQSPGGWLSLQAAIDGHSILGHKPGGKHCR